VRPTPDIRVRDRHPPPEARRLFYCEQSQMQPTIDTEPIVETLIAAMSKVPEAKSTRALHSELLSNLEIF
jgi:hypothetical protein